MLNGGPIGAELGGDVVRAAGVMQEPDGVAGAAAVIPPRPFSSSPTRSYLSATKDGRLRPLACRHAQAPGADHGRLSAWR
jgi:hypothetical protein